MKPILNSTSKVIYLQGPSGSGKSFLANALFDRLNLGGKVVAKVEDQRSTVALRAAIEKALGRDVGHLFRKPPQPSTDLVIVTLQEWPKSAKPLPDALQIITTQALFPASVRPAKKS